MALETAIADKLIHALQKECTQVAKAQGKAIEQLKADLAKCEQKIDLLLDMRLNDQISEPEYVSRKCILVNEKAELKGKLDAFEHNRKNRFELFGGRDNRCRWSSKTLGKSWQNSIPN